MSKHVITEEEKELIEEGRAMAKVSGLTSIEADKFAQGYALGRLHDQPDTVNSSLFKETILNWKIFKNRSLS